MLLIYQMRQSGRTVWDLAEEYGACPAVIRHKISAGKREELHIPPKHKNLSPPQILQMDNEGCSIEEIAQDANLQLSYVHCVLTTMYGLDLSKPVVVEDEPIAV